MLAVRQTLLSLRHLTFALESLQMIPLGMRQPDSRKKRKSRKNRLISQKKMTFFNVKYYIINLIRTQKLVEKLLQIKQI